MTNNPLFKKLMFALGVVIMLILLSVVFLFISSFKKPPPSPVKEKPVTQVDITTPLVVTAEPPVTKQLIVGEVQVFAVELDTSVNVSDVRATVSSSPPSDASAKSVVPTTTVIQGQKIILTTAVPTEPVTTYTLTLIYKGRVLLSQAYLSTTPAITPIPTNNPVLATHLPYETLNYILTYSKERNVYEMHFKYNPSSEKDMTTQFEEAKVNANNFIIGKGIDIKTITIEYLFK